MGVIVRLRILAAAIVALGFFRSAWASDSAPWPTRVSLDGGLSAGVQGVFAYDWNRFDGDRQPGGADLFDDAQTWRRQSVNLYLGEAGRFTVNVGYELRTDTWVDDYVGIETRAGRFRLGQFRTPVGWEDGNVASANVTFLERSLPERAVFEGHRVGIDWFYQGIPHWLLQVGAFTRHDLNRAAAGRSFAGRVVYNPVLEQGEVVHLGLAASRELRDDRTGRIRTPPEVNLTPVCLVDTGTLEGVERFDRQGLEAAWIHGPLLLQGEYLAMQAIGPAARDFHSQGYYLFGTWVLSGESRGYHAGSVDGIAPRHRWGALELALRYATLDLDDGAVMGGREHDWTLGVNWYIDAHFKLQANLIRAFSDRGNLPLDPTIYAMRAQLRF